MLKKWFNLVQILVLLGLFSCKSSVSENSDKDKNEKKEVWALFASNDPYERVRKLVGTQTFKVKLDKPEFVVGKKGTILKIEPNSFLYEDGTPVKGEVEIELGEVITMSDFIKSGISTMSDGKMLSTGGTFFIEARQGNKKLKINPEVGLDLMIPTPKKDKDMKLFVGENTPDSPNGPINWKLAEKPDQVSDEDDLQKTTEDLKKYGKTTDKDLLRKKYEDFKLFMLMIRDFKLEGEWYYDPNKFENANDAQTEKIHKSSVDSVKMFMKAYEKYIKSSSQNQEMMLQKNQVLKKALQNYKDYLKNTFDSDTITFAMLDSLDRYQKTNTIKKFDTSITEEEITKIISDSLSFYSFKLFESYSHFYNCDRFANLNKPLIKYTVKFKNLKDKKSELHLTCDELNAHTHYKLERDDYHTFSFPDKVPFRLVLVQVDRVTMELKINELNCEEVAAKNGNKKEIEFNLN